MEVMCGFGRSASATDGVTQDFPFTRILATCEKNEENVMGVLHIPADVSIWGVCFSVEVQRHSDNAIVFDVRQPFQRFVAPVSDWAIS